MAPQRRAAASVLLEGPDRARGGHAPRLPRHARAGEVEERVHLAPGPVPPEVQMRPLAVVAPYLEQLTDHEVLEDGAAQGMRAELLRSGDAEQVADQPCIEEVQFGRLDETPREVDV